MRSSSGTLLADSSIYEPRLPQAHTRACVCIQFRACSLRLENRFYSDGRCHKRKIRALPGIDTEQEGVYSHDILNGRHSFRNVREATNVLGFLCQHLFTVDLTAVQRCGGEKEHHVHHHRYCCGCAQPIFNLFCRTAVGWMAIRIKDLS